MKTFVDKIQFSLTNIDKADLRIFKETIINTNAPLIILGNGGSSAIASHIANDYTKVLKKKVFTFSDSAKISCYANDYGYENSLRRFIMDFEEYFPTVILVSSSGNSLNIINAARYAISKNLEVIGLTGFSESNLLNQLCKAHKKFRFYVNDNSYGVVECVHQIILHSAVDEI